MSPMADAQLKVSSPDGRTWTITTARQHRSFKETYEKPFFWAHVVVTAIMVVFFVLVIRSDWVGILSILVPIVVILWLVGFVNNTLRATISADTTGPPPDHRLWVVLKRFRLDRSVRDIREAIEQGRYTGEPPGTRLEEI
jgi:hypothetical protein